MRIFFFFCRNINDPVFVRCEFDLGVTGTPKEQVQEEFLTYLDVGSIGQLRVRRDGFTVRDVGGKNIHLQENFMSEME